MSIQSIKIFFVRCDWCRRVEDVCFSERTETEGQAAYLAQSLGWKQDGDKWRCPNCLPFSVEDDRGLIEREMGA